MCFIEIKQWQQSCLVKLGYKPMSYMDTEYANQWKKSINIDWNTTLKQHPAVKHET
jgi:hypothetical protein